MQITRQLLILLLAPLLSYSAMAQQLPEAGQVQALLSEERVQLVHSQPYYAAGERLWFTAFLSKIPSNIPPSKTLYVELLDAREQVILRQRLIVEEGKANGEMLLPENLPTGTYTLLGTTNWMRNYSKGQQYREPLLIVNAGEVAALRAKKQAEADRPLSVQFFPESNSLVAGVATKLAVVVTNAAGVGIAASGSIENSAGETVVHFQTDKSGLATVNFTPAPQEQYQAQVQAEGYAPGRVSVPEAKQNGLSLAVEEQTAEQLRVRVNNPSSWRYTLVAEAGGKVYFSQRGNAGGAIAVPWPAEASEAVRLLLLNPGGLVEAEQQVAQRQKQPLLSISTDRQQYSPRQQVTVTVQATHASGAPLAVAVTSIKPDFTMPLAINSALGRNAESGQLVAVGPDQELWAGLVSGKTEMVHGVESLVDAFVKDGVNAPFVNTGYRAVTDTAFVQALPESVVQYALQQRNRTRINEAYGLAEAHATAPVPRLPADRVARLDEYITFDNVEEALRETTTNLRLGKKKGRHRARLLYVAPDVKRMMKGEPIYLIDGVVVKGMEEILALDLNDISSFELTWMEEKLYAANLGHVADNGILAVYTKSGEARDKLREKGYATLFEQYNRPRVFVAAAPGAGAGTSATPDFRQLVYWESQLRLSSDGKATFSFFTTDQTGDFTIRVQGRTADGLPVKGEATYQVRLVK